MKEVRLSCTLRVVAGIGLATAVSTPVLADVVVLTPSRDNTMFSNGNSNGLGNAIFSGRTGGFGGFNIQRGLLAFSVADSLGAGSTIISARLEMVLIQTSVKGGQESHALHRLSADWGEGTSIAGGGTGAPPTAGDATWTHTFYPDQFWLVSGGDFSTTISASQTVGTALGSYTWGSTPQMVADVQAWLDNPLSAFGWVLIGNEVDANTAKKFASRDAGDAAVHPMLVIEFAPPPCPWDCGDGDGIVGIVDFLALLGEWGAIGTPCDLDGGGVGITDFLDLLGNWGACP